MSSDVPLDFATLRAAYGSGAASPTTIVRRIYADIARRGDDGVWVSLRPIDSVLAEAARLEALSPQAQAVLPLWGLPFGIKDSLDYKGLPTTAGCPGFDQFATGLVGTRVPGTAPSNPYNPDFIPGGSSSGSALAVALGQVSFALATDTAGSGRVPAALCNVVGLKPTRGRVSKAGLVPACRSFDCVTIMALTVPDAMEVLTAAQGIDEDDPYSREVPADVDDPIGRRFTCAVPTARFRKQHADAAAEEAFQDALQRLELLGGKPIEIDIAPFLEAGHLLYGPFVAERYADLGEFIEKQPDAVLPVTRQIIGQGRNVPATDLYRAQHRLAALAATTKRLWSDVDVLVVPTIPRPVSRAEIAEDPIGPNSLLGTYTTFGNLLDLSGIAVPAGFRPDGVPHGITILGPAFAETRFADLAARFHATMA
jgi:allophanate hydrolase/aspartyl-tRNA(Asn)/glutamyl-tRNA(Gln) amidotransferase subunit A